MAWLTCPLESAQSGNLVMGTVKDNVEKFIANPRFKFRIEVSWSYSADRTGMPDETTSELMEKVQEAFETAFKKDPVAILTGVYTGEGARDLVFYTLSLHIFQRKLNEVLNPFPTLPLTFQAEEDPEWEEYKSMLTLAQAADSDAQAED